MRRTVIAAVMPVAVACTAAGCGGSNKPSSTSAAPAATGAQRYGSGGASAGAPLTVKTAKFGRILAGAGGRTVYLFLADRRGKSSCAAACAAVWPPLSGPVRTGGGVRSALVGSTTRADGSKQVTYGGNPLYYYAKDKDSGDAYGEGIKSFGAEWYAVGADGRRVEKPGG